VQKKAWLNYMQTVDDNLAHFCVCLLAAITLVDMYICFVKKFLESNLLSATKQQMHIHPLDTFGIST